MAISKSNDHIYFSKYSFLEEWPWFSAKIAPIQIFPNIFYLVEEGSASGRAAERDAVS